MVELCELASEDVMLDGVATVGRKGIEVAMDVATGSVDGIDKPIAKDVL